MTILLVVDAPEDEALLLQSAVEPDPSYDPDEREPEPEFSLQCPNGHGWQGVEDLQRVEVICRGDVSRDADVAFLACGCETEREAAYRDVA